MKKQLLTTFMKKAALTMAVTYCILTPKVNADAQVAAYDFSFTPPFLGCANYSGKVASEGTSAYVYPKTVSIKTSYCLRFIPNTSEFDAAPVDKYYSLTVLASNTVEISTSTKQSFTYREGYGGAKGYYILMGYPSTSSFSSYNISGMWQP